MNPKLGGIFSRRSVREYQNKDISDDAVKDLLEAGMAAPSACCKDPWHFIVVRDKSMLGRLTEGLPNGKMLAHAAAGIVVCGDLAKAHNNQESFMLQDCSAAIENILVAAATLGLGTCWLGVHPRAERMEHVRKVLSMPPEITPISVISVGYPAEPHPARTRYADNLVHRGKW